MASFATQVQIRRGTDAENDAFTGAEGEVTMDLTNKQLRVHDGQTMGGMKIPNSETVFGTSQIQDGAITEPKLSTDLQTKINEKTSGAGRNIGDIFWTTRTDSALAGAVEANGAQYNFADVNQGQNNVQALLESGKLSYVSIADYESAISSKGWCDKIGYDSGSASFRVPKLTPYIVQKENIPVIGNGKTLGLTDGTWLGGLVNNQGNKGLLGASIGKSGIDVGEADSGHYISTAKSMGITTAPEKSGIIANLSSVASIGRIMIQLFNSATDEAVATCTSVLQDVANLNMGDYVIYWDSADSTDHSHAKPGVTTPTDHGWYRVYKSGWVEQGGLVGNPNGQCIPVTLPIGMANDSFTAIVSGNTSGIVANYDAITCERRSSTQILICTTGQQGKGCSWQVSGMAA